MAILNNSLVTRLRPLVMGVFVFMMLVLGVQATYAQTDPPYVQGMVPAPGSTNVPINQDITAYVFLPRSGQGVNPATLNATNVYVYRTADATHTPVTSTYSTSGGGDTISIYPVNDLLPNTNYTVVVTSNVQDMAGYGFVPYSASFTTGTDGGGGGIPGVQFEKVPSGATTGGFSNVYNSVAYGPDGRLYAAGFGGIHHWEIEGDGTLTKEGFEPLIASNDANPRMIIGIDFDPRSTANQLILWVTHNEGMSFINDSPGPHFSGSLARAVITNPGTQLESWSIQDMAVGFPRSVRDHLTNSVEFGPDNNGDGVADLYMTQGSISAMGARDNAWGSEPETVLAGAVMWVDVVKLEQYVTNNGGPLNVATGFVAGGGVGDLLDANNYGLGSSQLTSWPAPGSYYNPYNANAPVKLFATGVRNAYDLVWHSNGQLYVPTNGSASGGNAPATPGTLPASCKVRLDTVLDGAPQYTGPSVPAATNISNRNDFLFRVVEGGYYGHPNPTRCEWVLNGGNPTSGVDPSEVGSPYYPVGVQPDRNWRGYSFDFGPNKSANGVIEYQSNVFSGALQGKLLVTRYSGGQNIIVLQPGGANNDIVASWDTGIPGLSNGLTDPLDLTEDPNTGNLYVIEYDEFDARNIKISLLRPVGGDQPNINVDTNELIFNQPIGGGVSASQPIVVSNDGSATLTLNSITTLPPFQITNMGSVVTTLNAGESTTIQVGFDPSNLGPQLGSLTILSDDPTDPALTITLRGLGTAGTGGANEPSLQWILSTYGYSMSVGDDAPSTTVINSVDPGAPLLGQEVAIQTFEKATDGLVTIEPLAVFGPSSTPVTTLGWYQAGNTSAKNPLFDVPTGNQTLNPVISGSTSFDPGNQSFGFYSIWPFFSDREVYSQDQFNTFSSGDHQVRVYPLRDNLGTLVQNAYVVAFEEEDSPNDYQDIVFIVRDVKPATITEGVLQVTPDYFGFGAVKSSGTTPARPLTLRNVGAAPIQITSITTSSPFAIQGSYSGTTIPVGGQIQVNVTFTPPGTANSYTGNITIVSNALNDTVVHIVAGVSADGEGGNNEPSLQRILDAYDIPVDTGDNDAATTPIHRTDSVGRSLVLGDEIRVQAFQKAGTDSVVVEPIAAYAIDGNPYASIGWYPNENPNSLNVVFTGNQGSDQTLDVRTTGNLTFNPGSGAFGMFARWEPSPWLGRVTYQNDQYNRFYDPVAVDSYSIPHHVRIYPLKDATNSVVDNAYIVAYEEWTRGYDYNDVVFIIRNVVPIPSIPATSGIEVENLEWSTLNQLGLEGFEWMNQWVTFHNMRTRTSAQTGSDPVQVSDVATIRIHNNGTSSLQIFDIEASSLHRAAPSYIFPNGEDTTPPTIPPGGYYDLDIQYVATFNLNANSTLNKGTFIDTLTIQSSDPVNPTLQLTLGGLFSDRPVGPNEPTLHQVVNAFGFSTDLGGNPDQTPPFSSADYTAAGEEILAPYWEMMDPNEPVYIRQLAALHGCCSTNAQERLEIRLRNDTPSGGANSAVNNPPPLSYLEHDYRWGQTILPANLETSEGWLPAETILTAYNGDTGTKDLFFTRTIRNYDLRSTDGVFNSNDHRQRFWPVRDPEGNLVPGAFVMSLDYIAANHTCVPNGNGLCDYNDNIYLLTNIQPAEYDSVTYKTDITTTVTDADDPILLTEQLHYTVEVKNLTVHQAYNAVATINLPDNVAVISITPARGTCGTPSGGVVTCNIGTMNGGQRVNIDVVLTPLSSGVRTLSSAVTTTRSEVTTSNNSDSETVTVLNFTSIPATITVVKDAQPNTTTPFNFTGDLGNFQLIDQDNPAPVVNVGVNFQLPSSNGGNPPTGFTIADVGQPFGTDGHSYGWRTVSDSLPADASAGLRERTTSGFNLSQRTFNSLQVSGQPAYYWEYAVPNGTYDVTLSVGDTQFYDSTHAVLVEGTSAYVPPFVPNSGTRVKEVTVTVQVTDGALTVAPDMTNGVNTKLNYVKIVGGSPNTQSFLVEEGTYEISEILPSLWRLDDLTCTGNTSPTTPVNNGVIVTVASQDNVVCTFTNNEITGPDVDISKVADNDEVLVGADVTYTITVTNTGLTALNNVVITDELTPACDNTFASIPMGGTETYDCTITNIENGFTNIATVTASPADGSAQVSDSDTAIVTVVSPSIDISKTPDVQSGVNVGDTVSFDITVINTGDADLNSVTVSDALAPNCNRTIGMLAVGEDFTYSCQLANVQTTFTNIASVTGQWNGTPYTAQDSAQVILDGVQYGSPIYRVNAGGPTIGAIDGGPNWVGASGTGATTFANVGATATGSVSAGQDGTPGVVSSFHPSVPTGTVPASLFGYSRFVQPAGTNMNWQFPVANGEYEVRLFFANIYSGTGTTGSRVFNVSVEGSTTTTDGTSLTGYDIVREAGGTLTGIMETVQVNVTDGTLNMSLSHGAANNPLINGIEIVPITTLNPAVLGSDPTAYNFGDVPTGTPQTTTITLEHLGAVGSNPINISGFSLTGANPDQFSLNTTGTGTALGAGNTTTLEVTFNPDSYGVKTATLEVAHDGDSDNPLIIYLSGKGIPVPLPHLYFGTIGQAPTTTLTITAEINSGLTSQQIGLYSEGDAVAYTILANTPPTWFKGAAPAMGTAPAAAAPPATPITIQVNPNGLGIGTYNYSIQATADEYVSANLNIILQVVPKQVSITTEAGTNGTITPEGTFSIDQGSNVELTIAPDAGYAIDTVTVNGVDFTSQVVGNTLELTNVQVDTTVVATFVIVPTYTIEATAGTGGSINPTGVMTYSEGDSATYTIAADTGYSIASVDVDGVPQGPIATYTFNNITADHTISVTFEQLCSPISPDGCNTVPVSTATNVCLPFNGTGLGIVDGSGVPTGFTMVDNPSNFTGPNANVPGYVPANITVNGGQLTINATQGIQYIDVNTQQNALGVGFDADRASFTLRATVTSFPTVGANNLSQQAGIWFGLGEDDYLKMVIRRDNKIQLYRETAGVATEIAAPNAVGTVQGATVDVELILTLNPTASTVTASYSVNGGTPVVVATNVAIPATLFAGETLPGVASPVSYAGLFATTRNYATAPIAYSFDEFCIEPSDAVTNTNPTVTTNAPLMVLEGGSALISTAQLQATDAEHTASELYYVVSALPTNGTLNRTTFTQWDIDNNRVLYTHDGSETTSDSFDFQVFDVAGGSATAATFTINVTPVNDPPVQVNNALLTLDEGTSATITSTELQYTDPDLPGDILTYTVLSLPSYGTLTLDGTELALSDIFTQADIDANLLAYNHDGSNVGSDNFAFSVGDGTATFNGVFNIAVNLLNDAPVEVTNVALVLPEGGTRTITVDRLEYTDEEQATAEITYTLISIPVNGTLTNNDVPLNISDTFTQADINSELIVYMHDGSETTTDSFDFEVSDGTNTTAAATFNITISGVNNPPTEVVNDVLTVSEGAAGIVARSLLEYTDVEQTAANVVYTVTELPANGTLALNGTLLAVDDTFTQADINNNLVIYSHDGSETISDSFGFTVVDNPDPGYDPNTPIPGTFNIVIDPVNDAPELTVNEILFVVEGNSATIPVSRLQTIDADNTAAELTYTVTTPPANGTLSMTTFTQEDINNSSVIYTHDGSATTSDSFEFEVTDGTAAPISATFSITVVGEGEVPVANNDEATTGLNTPVSIDILTNDVGDLDPTTVFLTTPSNGTAVVDDLGIVLYTPNTSFVGTDTFTYTVDSTIGLTSNVATVTVTVEGDGGTGPTIVTNEALSLGIGQTALIAQSNLEAVDPDNSASELDYAIQTGPAHGIIYVDGVMLSAGGAFTQADINNNLVAYMHDGSATTSDSFTFTVTDGTTTTTVQTFNIIINAASDAVPINLFVSGNLSVYPLQLTYNWTHRASPDATSVPGDWYHIVVNKDGGSVVDLWIQPADYCTGVDCAVPYFDKTPPYVFDNGTYVWYVEAWVYDAATDSWTSLVSDEATFEINVPTIQPPTGIVVVPNQGRSTISWDDDPAATWYQFYLGNASGTVYTDWVEKTADMCDGTRCSFTPPADPMGGTYEYWMRSWGPTGFSSGGVDGWQGPFSVTLPSTPPVSPAGLFTANEVTGNPTFSWEGVLNATWYQVWVGERTGTDTWETRHLRWYLAAELGCENGGQCQLTSQIDLVNGTYDWAIQAWGPGGINTGGAVAGTWTNILSLTVDAQLPGIATLGAPLGSPGAPISMFSWTGVPGASWYELWIGDSANNTMYQQWFSARDLGCADSIATCFVDFGTALPAADYNWSVRAYSPAGLGEWASSEPFRAPEAP